MGKHEHPILDGALHGGRLSLAVGQMKAIRWALGALFFVLASSTFALDKTGVLASSNGATTVVAPSGGGAPLSRTYGAGASSGEALVRELFNATNPAGKTWQGTAARSFPWSSVAGLAVKGAMVAGGVYQAAMIASALNDIRCKYATGTAAWACEQQSPASDNPQMQHQYRAPFADAAWTTDPDTACKDADARASGGYTRSTSWVNGRCRGSYSQNGVYQGEIASDLDQRDEQISQFGCAEGFELVGNYCYSVNKPQPAQESDVATRLQNSPSAQANSPALLKDAVESGVPVPEPAPLKVSGPTTSPGATTTTTGPNGTTTSTTSYTNNYAGNTISYVTNNTTNVTNNAGDTTTTTTTSDPTPDKNPCELNPDTVGCAKLDKVDAPEIPTVEKPISVLPDAGWGADDASCPAPAMIVIHGGSLPMSYEPYCNFMHGVRPVVLALAALSAALILMGMRKAAED